MQACCKNLLPVLKQEHLDLEYALKVYGSYGNRAQVLTEGYGIKSEERLIASYILTAKKFRRGEFVLAMLGTL